MTKEEAMIEMELGLKVTHQYFSSAEYIKLTPEGNFRTEDGYVVGQDVFWADRPQEYWETGWDIYWG